MPMPAFDSPLVRFYSGEGTDDHGRTLADVLAFDHNRMEYVHDFIQWLFPTCEPSDYNPDAPTLTGDDVRAFRERPELREKLRRSFEGFLDFLGLEYVGDEVGEVAGRGPRRKVFEIPNHNWLRITRVLLCLKTLGLDDECRAFFEYLELVYDRGDGVAAGTFAYWRDASRGVARSS